MPDLAALQAEMAEALLSGRNDTLTAAIQPGPISAAEALAVHRGAALHGLTNALRLSHPTVEALVGEAFFDQAARAFVQAHPPAGAWLAGYGEAFAEFLESYEPVRELPYLADVARFDFALDKVGGDSVGDDGPTLDLGDALLTLDRSLRLIGLRHPAPAIRDAIEEDESRLAALDMRPSPQTLALWRRPDGVGVRALSRSSAAFLAAVIAGRAPDDSFCQTDLDDLRGEVFTAPFARLSLQTS